MGYHFIPESIRVFQTHYSRKKFLNDIMAGIIVGIVALPLAIAFAFAFAFAIAFAFASGVKPEQGIYTAVVAGFLISIFSGSRVQMNLPELPFPVPFVPTVEREKV